MKNIDTKLKLLGALGFDLTRLQSDAKQAEQLIGEIDKRAKTLGDSFEAVAKRLKQAFKFYPLKDFIDSIDKLDRAVQRIENFMNKKNQKLVQNSQQFQQKIKQMQDKHDLQIQGMQQQHQQKLLQQQNLFNQKNLILQDRHRNVEAQRESRHQQKMSMIRQSGNRMQGDLTARRFESLTSYAFDASLIYGSLMGVKSIMQSIKEIEKQDIELQRVFKATNSEVREMRKNSFDVAQLTGQQVIDVQKIQNLWARAGKYSKEAVMELTKVTGVGVNTAGFTDVEQSVSYLNSAINQMKVNWTDAGKVLDSWVKVADRTAVKTTKDLADSLMKWGSQAKDFGMTYHEVNAITALMAARTSKSGTEIGNSMKTIMTYFKDKKGIDTLAKYGIEVKKNAYEYNNFVQIMSKLNKVWNEMKFSNNQTGMNEIAKSLGKVHRINDVKVLIEGWKDFAPFLEISLTSTGFALEQNEMVVKSLASQLENLKTEFMELAQELADAGLLEQIKAFVTGVREGIEWFNGLSAGTKRAVLAFVEFSVILALVNKSAALLFGSNMVRFIQLLIAKTAVYTGSQWALNSALATGAGEMVIVNRVDATGVVIKEQLTRATLAQAQAQGVVNVAMAEGAGVGGVAGGVMAGLSNPIGWLIILLGAVTIAWQKHNATLAEAKRKAEDFVQKEKELNDVLKRGVVSEHDIPVLEEKIAKIDELGERYKKLKPQVEWINGKANPNYNFSQANKYRKELKDITDQMAQLGITTGNYAEKAEELRKVLYMSGSEQNRNAFEHVKKLKTLVEENRLTLEQIEHLKQVKKGSQEYRDILTRLNAIFPQFAGSWDEATQTTKMNTKAIEEAILAHNGITEAQLGELSAVLNTSQAQKDANLARVKSDITMTEGAIARGKVRIQVLIQEQRALYALASGSISAYRAIDGLNPAKMAARANLMKQGKWNTLLDQAGQQKLLNDELTRMGMPELPDSFKNTQLTDAQIHLKELDAKLANLKVAYEVINKIKVNNAPSTNKYLPGGEPDKDGKSIPQFDEIEARMRSIDNINSKLTSYKNKLDALADTTSNYSAKGKLLNEVIYQNHVRQSKLHEVNNQLRGSLSKVTGEIENYIKGWGKKTPTEQMNSFNKLSEKAKEKVSKLIDTHEKLSNAIRGNSDEWYKAL